MRSAAPAVDTSGTHDIWRVSPYDPADVAAIATLRYAWRAGEKGERGAYAPFEVALGAWWRAHAETHSAFLGAVSSAGTGQGGLGEQRDPGEPGARMKRAEPVGMAWLGLVARIPGPEHFDRTSGIIQSVFVRPEARGHGLGLALVTAAIEHARGRGLGYVAVHPSERSYPLYRRAGFADTSGVLELGLSEARRP